MLPELFTAASLGYAAYQAWKYIKGEEQRIERLDTKKADKGPSPIDRERMEEEEKLLRVLVGSTPTTKVMWNIPSRQNPNDQTAEEICQEMFKRKRLSDGSSARIISEREQRAFDELKPSVPAKKEIVLQDTKISQSKTKKVDLERSHNIGAEKKTSKVMQKETTEALKESSSAPASLSKVMQPPTTTQAPPPIQAPVPVHKEISFAKAEVPNTTQTLRIPNRSIRKTGSQEITEVDQTPKPTEVAAKQSAPVAKNTIPKEEPIKPITSYQTLIDKTTPDKFPPLSPLKKSNKETLNEKKTLKGVTPSDQPKPLESASPKGIIGLIQIKPTQTPTANGKTTEFNFPSEAIVPKTIATPQGLFGKALEAPSNDAKPEQPKPNIMNSFMLPSKPEEAKAPQPILTGLFSNLPATNPTLGSLFGGVTPVQASPAPAVTSPAVNFFGGKITPSTTTQTKPNIFGGKLGSTTTPELDIFKKSEPSTSPILPTSGMLFGSKPSATSAPPTGPSAPLFPTGSSTGIFAKITPNPTATPGGIFDSVSKQQPLFGGGLFKADAAGASTTSSLLNVRK